MNEFPCEVAEHLHQFEILSRPHQLKWALEQKERFNAITDEHVFTTITELANAALILDPAVPFTVKCLLLMIMYVRVAKPKDRTVLFFNKIGRGTGTATFDRMVVVVDFLAPEGKSIGCFLLDGGQNANFFARYLDERDTGIFGELLGAMVVLLVLHACNEIAWLYFLFVGPEKLIFIKDRAPIVKYMSSGTMPLLFTTSSVIPVVLKPHIRLKPKNIIDASMKQQAFHWVLG